MCKLYNYTSYFVPQKLNQDIAIDVFLWSADLP